MRWLLAKDLTILRRSPLLTALLVAYPIVIAVLIGFALSGGPDKPRVAFLNQVPEGTPLNVGGESFDVVGARDELCDRIECVRVESEEEARELVESGDVLGALILPPDLISKLQSLGGLNPEQPTVKVLVNEEDPGKGQLVDDRISRLLSDANLRVSQRISDVSIGYLGILLDGGSLAFLGDDFEILGLRNAEDLLTEVRDNLPVGAAADREAIDRVIRFASLAAENLDVADDLLGAVSQPIQVDKEIVRGGSTSLDTFAISVAATITLMFVTVLLVAASLALEREENAFGRLVRTLVTPLALLVEKILLGVGVTATLAQLAMTRAYRLGDTLVVGSLAYSTVVFASLFGILLWGEILAPASWAAIALIIASGVISTRATARKPLV